MKTATSPFRNLKITTVLMRAIFARDRRALEISRGVARIVIDSASPKAASLPTKPSQRSKYYLCAIEYVLFFVCFCFLNVLFEKKV